MRREGECEPTFGLTTRADLEPTFGLSTQDDVRAHFWPTHSERFAECHFSFCLPTLGKRMQPSNGAAVNGGLQCSNSNLSSCRNWGGGIGRPDSGNLMRQTLGYL